jgi:hypothetical protein
MSRKIGKNCANTGFPFANMFAGSGFFNNGSLAYDAKGWPTSVTGSQVTRTQTFTDYHAPAGVYSMYGLGSGKFRIPSNFTGAGVLDAQGQRAITVADSGSGWRVDLTLAQATYFAVAPFEIVASTPDAGSQVNHLRDIKWMLPGHTPDRIFAQSWLDMNAPYDTLRFLDWGVINGSAGSPDNVTAWNQASRSGGQQFAFSMRGRPNRPGVICEEYQAAVFVEMKRYCNRTLNWWCQAPHGATQNWCDGLADLCANGAAIDGYAIDPLPAGSTVILEFSNELPFGWPQLGVLLADRTAFLAANPGVSIGGFEYVAHRKARLAQMSKDAFSRIAPAVPIKTAVMSQLGVPAYGQLDINQFKLPNIFTGVANTPIDLFGAAFYFSPTLPDVYLGLDQLLPQAAQYGTGGAAAKAAAIDYFFAGMEKCFTDNLPLVAQYVAKANANGIQFASYEIGEQSNAFTLSANPTLQKQKQALLQACKADPRYESLVARVFASLPDGSGPLVWFNDCQNDPNFGWRSKQWPTQPLSQCPAERAMLALVGEGPARAARRMPRGLMRLRSTTP